MKSNRYYLRLCALCCQKPNHSDVNSLFLLRPCQPYDKENRKEEEGREQKRGMERGREERYYETIILLYKVKAKAKVHASKKKNHYTSCSFCHHSSSPLSWKVVEIVKEMPITLQSCPTCTLLTGICLGILLKLVDVFIKSSARRQTFWQ